LPTRTTIAGALTLIKGEGTSEIGEGTSVAAGTSAGTKLAETGVRTGFSNQINCP